MQSCALLTEAACCYLSCNNFLLPLICLCWKFSSQMFSISWQCFLAPPFFWKRINARPMCSWPYCFLGAFYADFQQFALAVHNLRNGAKSISAAWCFFGQQAIKEEKYRLPKYPQVMKLSIKFSCCLNDGDIYHPAGGFFAVKNVINPSRSGMKTARLRVGQTFIWARLNRLWTRSAREFSIISAGIFCILRKL